ncbi:MAG: tetratricopeptide repeat protein [Saprospiraceae bacterium]|nr:tetratricopeptide repeat protein [Saprospiraceae bacterium]
MRSVVKFLSFLSIVLLFANQSVSQCGTWIGLPNQSDAENAHSIYRQAMKMNDFAIAFENWQTAYKLAPSADGKRDYHFMDGVELYKQKLATTTDDKEKEEFGNIIIRLYDEAITCYKSNTIALKSTSPDALDKKIGYLYGRKAYDMFYFINSSYNETMEALDNSIKYAGMDAEYIIFDPYAKIIVWEFKGGRMNKEKAVEIYKQLNEIAEYNISNNETYSEGYQQSKAAMDYSFIEIEKEIFDCEFFKEKLLPDYEENSDDPVVLQRVLTTLLAQGCDISDPVISKLNEEWKKYATEENARLRAEYESNNPAAAAKSAYDEGKYNEAISKYNQAIKEESDGEKKATYLFAIASIQFRKLNLYSNARSTAYEAAKFRPNWGRPYMLIGDMYAKTARSCGDAWNQRLAILAALDKYSYAKSLDGSVASEANERIGAYSGSLPEKADGFMRGVSEGQSATVGCWIGENVKLRFKN